MENKEFYFSPMLEIIEAGAQNVICQSGGTEQYDYETTDNWF